MILDEHPRAVAREPVQLTGKAEAVYVHDVGPARQSTGGGALAAKKLPPRRNRVPTQEVPVVPPPAEPPADAPHVTT